MHSWPWCAAAALALNVAALPAQGSLQVSVSPQILSRSGDTVSLSYTVHVLPGVSDSLVAFLVAAPGLVRPGLPGPPSEWLVKSFFKNRPVAIWSSLGKFWGAGDSTPPLPMTGVGLLAPVPYWAENNAPLDSIITLPLPLPAPGSDTVVDVPGVQGTTIGVVPFPPDNSVSGLATRLGALIDQACALGWIDNRGICNSLKAKVGTDPGSLGALANELNAQRGKHVSEAAYLLLSDNLQYMLARL